MPLTKALLELPNSPIDVGSGETRTVSLDLTNALNGGSINSPVVKVIGGPMESDSLWIDTTTTNYMTGSVVVVGNVVKLQLHALVVGYAYRVVVTWNSALSAYDTYQRFIVVRCPY